MIQEAKPFWDFAKNFCQMITPQSEEFSFENEVLLTLNLHNGGIKCLVCKRSVEKDNCAWSTCTNCNKLHNRSIKSSISYSVQQEVFMDKFNHLNSTSASVQPSSSKSSIYEQINSKCPPNGFPASLYKQFNHFLGAHNSSRSTDNYANKDSNRVPNEFKMFNPNFAESGANETQNFRRPLRDEHRTNSFALDLTVTKTNDLEVKNMTDPCYPCLNPQTRAERGKTNIKYLN